MVEKDIATVTALTENEIAWLSFLRLLCGDNVPGPTLVAVQALRLGLSGKAVQPCADGC